MGVGLMQIGSGIEYLSGLTSGKGLWLILAAIVTFIFVLSCVSGIEKGLKRMSSFTSYAFIFLLVAILILGPTAFILNMSTESLGAMLSEIPKRTMITNAMFPGDNWASDWWLQYVGSFIVYGTDHRRIPRQDRIRKNRKTVYPGKHICFRRILRSMVRYFRKYGSIPSVHRDIRRMGCRTGIRNGFYRIPAAGQPAVR